VVEVFSNLLILVSGFVLLVLSGDKLVETSILIARRWRVPASVIAVTIIAAGTSAPEIVTSFMAGLRGNSDISIGNVIGSNTFNILAVGGLSLILQPFGNVRGTWISWTALLMTTFLFYYALSDFELSQFESFLFLVFLTVFVVFSFFRESDSGEGFANLPEKSFARTLVFFLISFAGLILGAELALRGGIALGEMAGLSERVIAITIISAGTGLPELATSVAAAYRGHSDIAIANIIGSNIFNSLIIPGLTGSFFLLKVNQNLLAFDFYVMAAATVTIGILYLIRHPMVRRGVGISMLLAYSVYAIHLLIE
jgi:cation:H+ antiporter